MSLIVIVIHIIVCIALIMIVLLQTGKGADMGAAFGGGGSNTLFGAAGAATFLSKMTTAAAVIFMLTSLWLAYMASDRGGASILERQPAAEQTAPAQTEEGPATPGSLDEQPTANEETETGKTQNGNK